MEDCNANTARHFQAADGFYFLLSFISQRKLHLHLSSVTGEGWWGVHSWPGLELWALTPALLWPCRGSGGSCGHSLHHGPVQVHSWLNEYFKQLGFCQVRTHSQTKRSSQDKACPGKSLFLIWHSSLEQEGSDPRSATAGVCLWGRFKTQPQLIPEFPAAKCKTLLVYSPDRNFCSGL